MKNKKILIVTFILLAILSVGAVSASEDADVLAQDSDEIVVGNTTTQGGATLADSGNFTVSNSEVSLNNAYDRVATLNLKSPDTGRILMTNEEDDILGEKNLTSGDYYQSLGSYCYDFKVRDLNIYNFYPGSQLVNIMFYSSQDTTPSIHEVYGVDRNPNTNSIVIGNVPYIEIYDGYIDENYDEPIIAVYSNVNTYDISITDVEEWQYSYTKALNQLNRYDYGIYSKNKAASGWYYYGVTATDFINNGFDFNAINDGDTLNFIVRKQNYGDYITTCERNITFEGDGFYLSDRSHEEPVNPTIILEVYGNEYTPIDYDNGLVFSIIISGDERTGSWKPVDELSSGRVYVYSGDVTLLNVMLSDLDYNVTGFMNNIEHIFTLNEVDNFTGLNDGDAVEFVIVNSGVQEVFVDRFIYFEDNYITLAREIEPQENNPFFITSPGPVDPDEEVGVGLVIQMETTGILEVYDLNNNRVVVENLNISSILPEYREEGIEYRIPVEEFDFNELDNGDVVVFRFYGDDGSYCEDLFTFAGDLDEGRVHFDNYGPEIEVEEIIETNKDSLVATLVIPANPFKEQEEPYFTGNLEVWGREECLYSQSITEENATEIQIYLSDLDYFEGWETGNHVVFEFNDFNGEPLAYEPREFRREDGSIILARYDENDFDAIFLDANVADNDTVVIIPQDQIPEGVDDEFSIFVEFWGTETETRWNISNLTLGDSGYEWTTADLFINEMMWDIFPHVDMDITVRFYRDGDDAEQAGANVNIYNTPYISLGEVDLSNSESVVTFAYFPKDADDIFIIRIYKDGRFFADKTFFIDDMDQYREDNEYNLYLNDLGITDLGEYDVSVIFTDYDTQEDYSYNGTFNVVPFTVYFWNDWDEMTMPFCRIGLPEGTEGTVVIKLNGSKVYENSIEDMDYHEYYRGPGYYVIVNSLNITQSGWYEAEVTVATDDVTRTVSTENYVNVTENTFELNDCIYGDSNLESHIGTAISPDSEIILYLNGKKAATGSIDLEGIYFDYDKSYVDIYGSLLPGEYQARIEIDGVTVCEDTFAVLNNSGNVYVEILNDTNMFYVVFQASMPPYGNLEGYSLEIFVDSQLPGDRYYDYGDPLIHYEGDELAGFLDNQPHSIFIGEFEPGDHIIYFVYRTDMDVPLDEQDFFVALYNITVQSEGPVPTYLIVPDVTTTYNTTGSIAATLNDVYDNPVSGVNVKITVGDIAKTLKTNANGKVSLDISSLTPGNYTATVKSALTDIYDRAEATAKVTVNKVATVIEASDVAMLYNTTGNIVATLKDINGNAISGINVKITVGSIAKTLKTNANGQVSLPVSGLDVGTYTVTIKSATTDIYQRASGAATLDVISKLPAKLTLYNITKIYGEGASVMAVLSDIDGNAISGVNVKITVGDLAKTLKTNANGQVSLDIGSLMPGNYVSTAKSAVTDIYDRATATGNVVVNKVMTELIVPDVVAIYNTTSKVTATLVDSNTVPVSGVNVKITVGSLAKTLKTDANGQVALDIKGLDVGTYTVSVKSATTDIYERATATATADVVTKIATVLDVPDVTTYYNCGDKIVAILNDVNGNPVSGVNVKITVGSLAKTLKTDEVGQVALGLDGLDIGSYTASIKSATTDVYERATATANVVITKMATELIVLDSVSLYNTTGNVKATLIDAYGLPVSGVNVKITVGSLAKTLKTDANGKVALDISSLAPGNYAVSVKSATTDIYERATATASAQVVSKLSTRLFVDEVIAFSNISGSVSATLMDQLLNPVNGVNVKITVGNLAKTLKTDADGKVSLDISSLAPGNYTVSVKSATTDIYERATVTSNAVVSADKIDTVLFIEGESEVGVSDKLPVRLLDVHGNSVSNVNVKITIGSIAKTLKTDDFGYVVLDVSSLAPGEYTVSAKSATTEMYNRATATGYVIKF